MPQWDEVLKRIYFAADDPGGLSSVQNLYRRARAELPDISLADVREFLSTQPAYTLHRPYRKRFRRNPTFAQGIDYQWQADLADLEELSKANDRSRYLLTVIDVFSRYAWAVPAAKKTGAIVRDALREVFHQAGARRPKHLHTDKGKEFFNKEVQELLRAEGVHHFASESDQKAALVERFNRTLKLRMAHYLTGANTMRYIDILPKLLSGYNASLHRSIGMAPRDVTKDKEAELWRKLYGRVAGDTPTTPTSSPRAVVRLSKVKGVVEKGHHPNWTEEMFRVLRHVKRPGRKGVYKLEDWAGEPIEGQFYEEEVQQVEPGDLFFIEREIRKRRVNGRREVLVKWRGWPDKFNSWIDEKEVVEYGPKA